MEKARLREAGAQRSNNHLPAKPFRALTDIKFA
jgi:hypothetical protein